MRIRNSIRYLLSALVLILLLLIILYIRNRSPFGKADSSFSVDPGREITAIEISSEGKKVVLSQSDNIWKVNQETEARKSIVTFVLRILGEMRIKSPVSSEMFDNDIVLQDIKPVRVKVYEKRKLLRSFYVYRVNTNKYGNIMKLKERSRPFIVHFPGFEGDIGSVFNPDELFWRPYTLFNLLPSEIASISLENNIDPPSSFSIEISDNTYRLSDLKKSLSGWDSSRIRRYISYYILVPFESWAFDIDKSDKDSLAMKTPAYRISVTDISGRIIKLSLWERSADGKKDTDRLWARKNDDEEYMIIRYFDIDPLLRKLSYFFPGDESL